MLTFIGSFKFELFELFELFDVGWAELLGLSLWKCPWLINLPSLLELLDAGL